MKLCFVVLSTIMLAGCQLLSPGPGTAQAGANIDARSGSNVQGKITFREIEGGVLVTANVTGLKPNSEHGFHIHDKGDCSATDASSAGGHFNPDGASHGHHQHDQRHAGDMPNLISNAKGEANTIFKVTSLSFSEGKYQVLNRAVVIHANGDDYQSQPAGNAGGRIGCGTIARA